MSQFKYLLCFVCFVVNKIWPRVVCKSLMLLSEGKAELLKCKISFRCKRSLSFFIKQKEPLLQMWRKKCFNDFSMA